MWPHKELGWWASVLTVIGLVLLLPASIAANLLTPKIKNWWSERSIASLRERVEKLEKEFAEIEAFPLISDAESRILELLMASTYLLVTLGWVCTACEFMALITLQRRLGDLAFAIGFGPIIILIVIWGIAMGRAVTFYNERSPAVRRKLEESIQKLSTKRASMKQD
jgi:hypothetical protein